MLNRNDLHEYQNSAIQFIKTRKKCALFLDMGLGKTTTSLTAASDFLDDMFVSKVLIIAPLRVANSVWRQEAAKWEHLQHLKISVCTGNLKNRVSAIGNGSEILVINRENIPWLVNNSRWEWDMIIVDESSSFKSHSSLRFKSLKKILKYVRSIVLLTGTPSPNGLLDLWPQLYLIDSGERLGRTISGYRQRFFAQSGYMGYDWKIRDGAQDEIHAKIEDVCLTMSADDYLDLPSRMDVNEYISLPAKARKQYKELEKEFILSLEDGLDIETPSAAALMNKLLQMCNGAIYDEHGEAHEIHDSKIKSLKEMVEDNPSENLLVAYNFKSDLQRLIKAFPDAKVLSKSGDELVDWNNGKIKMLLAHPASAGHGLNAQYGGSVVVWFGLNWSLELYQQFNARLHRQGQEKPVRVVHIVAEGCVDEKIQAALAGKAKTQSELLDYLKFVI